MSWLLTKIEAQRRLANKLIGPIIAERLNDLAENSEKLENRPVCGAPSHPITDRSEQNDLISWLVEACPPNLRTVPLVTNRLLVVNFAAIHTSSIVRGPSVRLMSPAIHGRLSLRRPSYQVTEVRYELKSVDVCTNHGGLEERRRES